MQSGRHKPISLLPTASSFPTMPCLGATDFLLFSTIGYVATTALSTTTALSKIIRRRPMSKRYGAYDDDNNDGLRTLDGNDEIDAVLGKNWMHRSASVDFMPSEMHNGNTGTDSDSIYVDVGIDGSVFGTGELSRRMYGALMTVSQKKYPDGNIPDDLSDLYLLYAMDASAKEAVKAAMDGFGFALNLEKDEALQDEGAWGRVDGVVLIEDKSTTYPSFKDAIAKGDWEPGDGYSFVVREVPARRKAMDLDALLRALDPDGKLREEAMEKGILLPRSDEEGDVRSLAELLMDCEQRVRSAPFATTDEAGAFCGGKSKGYSVISRSALLKSNRNADGSERENVFLHVMDSLANHGCLIVDLTDEDKLTNDATIMSKMWKTTSDFFHRVVDANGIDCIPSSMQLADGVGSSHAMVGFASLKNGDNQFLETRIRRLDGTLLPDEIYPIIGEEGARSMIDSFQIMSEVGKDIIRIATAASSVEAKAFLTIGSVVSQEDEGSPSIAGLSFEDAIVSGIVEKDSEPSKEDIQRAKILASDAAILLTEEIMDDGKPLPVGAIGHEGLVSMSPHRLCRYSNNNQLTRKDTSEVFGAHTDTSFVTIVPAAQISGLEVFDDDSLKWYRPELNARRHAKQLDPTGGMEEQFPWHCRYLVVMPGELLQLVSRNNIPAVVHRVLATTDAPRLSAPVLLRARMGTTMDVERYMGSLDKAGSLLMDSNGLRMEEIHAALQPLLKT